MYWFALWISICPGPALQLQVAAPFRLPWHTPKDEFTSARADLFVSRVQAPSLSRKFGAGLGAGYPVPQRSLSQNH